MPKLVERRGAIGIVLGSGDNESFKRKTDFSLQIVAKVEGAKDGYVARVTRIPGNVTRYVNRMLKKTSLMYGMPVF